MVCQRESPPVAHHPGQPACGNCHRRV